MSDRCSKKRPFSLGILGLVLGAVLTIGGTATAQPLTGATQNEEQALTYANLMAQAATAIRQGNWTAAVAAARAAFFATRDDIERVNAARLAASAHFRAGQFSRAEWWLRLALNNADENGSAAAVRRDFARVRQSNPLTARLSFTAAPNNNVNNGSSSETVTIFNLPFVLSADARALSGYEVSGSVDLRYRIAQSEDFATDVGLLLYGRTFELTPSAAAAAPGVQGSDFAFSVVELMLAHTRNLPGLPGPTSFGLNIGQNWFGGDAFTRYGRATIGQKFRISNSTGGEITTGYERQISVANGGVASDIYSIGVALNRQMDNRNTIGISLRLQQTGSADPGTENTATRAQIRYSIAKPVLGTQLSFSLSAERRDFDFSIYDAAGRQDLTVAATASFIFVNTSYFGFSPAMSLEANQTSSNVDLFNRQTVAVRFGLQSAF